MCDIFQWTAIAVGQSNSGFHFKEKFTTTNYWSRAGTPIDQMNRDSFDKLFKYILNNEKQICEKLVILTASLGSSNNLQVISVTLRLSITTVLESAVQHEVSWLF